MIPFAKMHPSMAKLPSQDDTALAFAEVFDFLVYLENLVGFNKLGDLLQLMGDGKSLEAAIKTIFGKSLSRLEKAWKKDLEKRDFKIVKGLIKEEKKFKGFDKSENESTEKLKAEEKAESEGEKKEGEANAKESTSKKPKGSKKAKAKKTKSDTSEKSEEKP